LIFIVTKQKKYGTIRIKRFLKMKKKVKISLRSEQVIRLPISSEEAELLNDMLSAEPLVTEVESEGELEYKKGTVTIRYEETEATGLENCVTSISFSDRDPGRVSMYRSGPVRTALMFCGGQRYISVYETEYGGFEVGIYTERCDNTIGPDGGELSIVYDVEIRGSEAEHTGLYLKVRVTDEEHGD